MHGRVQRTPKKEAKRQKLIAVRSAARRVARLESKTCIITRQVMGPHPYPFYSHFFGTMPFANRHKHMVPQLKPCVNAWGDDTGACITWLDKLAACLDDRYVNAHVPVGAARFHRPLWGHCMVVSKAKLKNVKGLSTNKDGHDGYVHMCMEKGTIRCLAHRFVLWCTFGPPTMFPEAIQSMHPRVPSAWREIAYVGYPQPRFIHGTDALAMHSCNVSMCLNPLHLYWGYAKENHHGHTGGTAHLAAARSSLFSFANGIFPYP